MMPNDMAECSPKQIHTLFTHKALSSEIRKCISKESTTFHTQVSLTLQRRGSNLCDFSEVLQILKVTASGGHRIVAIFDICYVKIRKDAYRRNLRVKEIFDWITLVTQVESYF